MADQNESPPPSSTADGQPEEENATSVGEVVSQVTVKALQEIDTGDMEQPADQTDVQPASSSRPASAKGSRAGSRPTSATGKPLSRPASVAERPESAARSPSAAERRSSAGSRKGSRPATAARSRTGSAQDRPLSGGVSKQDATSESPVVVSGSRPGSAQGRPSSAAVSPKASLQERVGSAKGSRKGSATERPKSGVASRRSSATKQRPSSSQQQVATGSRPASAAQDTHEPQAEQSNTEQVPQDTQEAQAEQPYPEQAPQDDDAEEPVDDDDEDHFLPLEAQFSGAPVGGDGGDDGGDSSGDEGGDQGEQGDLVPVEESDEDSDNETDMVVLDPNHPLMKRFQTALKNHLTKQLERVTLELRELEEGVKTKGKEREDLGVELYGVQQELARYQMILEKKHDLQAEESQKRSQEETQLIEIREMYKDSQLAANREKKKCSELQTEVENLALRLFYMEHAKEDVRSDIAIMRRAAEKAETEVAKAEIDKQKQDLFVDRLVEQVDKLKEEVAMFEAQLIAQKEETKIAKEALMEAHFEIEAIGLEKKQLFQQWNSSLIGMRRRDEAHAAMQEALRQQQQKILSLETEIEAYKKTISKEQEQNEKLTLILNKTETDIATIKKMFNQCQAKHDALKAEYATYTRMLHETEQALNRASMDKTLKENEVSELRKLIEREFRDKMELEDMIMEKMRTQLTMDKASQYTDKLIRKTRERSRTLEQQMAEVENNLSRDILEISNVCTRIEQLEKVMAGLDEAIHQKNEIINRSDMEIVRRNAIIERKQNLIDQYNKRLEHLISSAGGVELGPLEITINSLMKSIDAKLQELADLQQLWLRQQSELVRLTKEREEQQKDVETHKKQLTILSQRKIRIENEIESQNREVYDIERNVRNMQNDVVKLNTLLHKETGTQSNLQQETILMEGDFIASLKEAEKESIGMQAKLEELKEEKERLLNSLVEAERQIMLWEKKTQLARETRAAVDSDIGQGEIRAMKSEIHRMQVRYTQLMKQQEKMIQEMEKAVSRRDTIVTRGDAQSKLNKKVLTKGTFERQQLEMRKKIKQTIQDANSCDNEIRDLRDNQQEISHVLEEKQRNVQQLQSSADTCDGDIERLMEQKQRNLSELLSKQQKTKYFQQAKDGKYVMLCKSPESLETEAHKQTERMHALSTIVDRLNQEFPYAQPSLRKVTLALTSRLASHDEQTV